MTFAVERRQLLIAGGAAFTVGGLPRAAAAGVSAATGSIALFDPAIAQAREFAQASTRHGTRLVALEGDPVRFWRDMLAGGRQPIAGFTRWSDYVVLRGLAAEQRMRVRREENLSSAAGTPLFGWLIV